MSSVLLAFCLTAPLAAQEKLPPPLAAKFLKIFCSADGGSGKIACSSAEMATELQGAGVVVEADALFAWAESAGELAKYQKENKIVVVPTVDLLKAGAYLAIVAEGGKPAVYISGAGRANPRVPSTVKKIARPI